MPPRHGYAAPRFNGDDVLRDASDTTASRDADMMPYARECGERRRAPAYFHCCLLFAIFFFHRLHYASHFLQFSSFTTLLLFYFTCFQNCHTNVILHYSSSSAFAITRILFRLRDAISLTFLINYYFLIVQSEQPPSNLPSAIFQYSELFICSSHRPFQDTIILHSGVKNYVWLTCPCHPLVISSLLCLSFHCITIYTTFSLLCYSSPGWFFCFFINARHARSFSLADAYWLRMPCAIIPTRSVSVLRHYFSLRRCLFITPYLLLHAYTFDIAHNAPTIIRYCRPRSL